MTANEKKLSLQIKAICDFLKVDMCEGTCKGCNGRGVWPLGEKDVMCADCETTGAIYEVYEWPK